MERRHDVRRTLCFVFSFVLSPVDMRNCAGADDRVARSSVISPRGRLTGLLSFMLSDEMTTGSVTTSDAEKRSYAARSHAWNLEQRRYKEAFPDVS